jgi:hypothetical protein
LGSEYQSAGAGVGGIFLAGDLGGGEEMGAVVMQMIVRCTTDIEHRVAAAHLNHKTNAHRYDLDDITGRADPIDQASNLYVAPESLLRGQPQLVEH